MPVAMETMSSIACIELFPAYDTRGKPSHFSRLLAMAENPRVRAENLAPANGGSGGQTKAGSTGEVKGTGAVSPEMEEFAVKYGEVHEAMRACRHDVADLLAHLQNLAQLMVMKGQPEGEKCLAAVKQMTERIDRTLIVIDKPHTPLEFAAMLKRVFSDFSVMPEQDRKPPRVEMDVRVEESNGTETVLTLQDHWKNIGHNMIKNAMRAGATTVRIIVRRSSFGQRGERREAMLVQFQDDGIGIDPAGLSRLNDEGNSSQYSTKPPDPHHPHGIGTGTVYAIIVKRGRGHLLFESIQRTADPVDHGTTVSLWLPLYGSQPQKEAPAEPPSRAPVEAGTEKTRTRIAMLLFPTRKKAAAAIAATVALMGLGLSTLLLTRNKDHTRDIAPSAMARGDTPEKADAERKLHLTFDENGRLSSFHLQFEDRVAIFERNGDSRGFLGMPEVKDYPDGRSLISFSLPGCVIRNASGTETPLPMLLASLPEGVFGYLMLPKKNGWEAACVCGERNAPTLFPGFPLADTVHRMREAGPDGPLYETYATNLELAAHPLFAAMTRGSLRKLSPYRTKAPQTPEDRLYDVVHNLQRAQEDAPAAAEVHSLDELYAHLRGSQNLRLLINPDVVKEMRERKVTIPPDDTHRFGTRRLSLAFRNQPPWVVAEFVRR